MADTYNVFISWSGERSKMVAAALHGWLPMVLQFAKPWMSEEDIEKGSRGLEEIGKALEAMSVGVICLTPDNLDKPWILFEAGALSKTLGERTRVCPYLFGDFRGDGLRLPLGMFQATRADKKETRKLVGTVNRALGSALGEDRVDIWFEREWPQLKAKLDAIPAANVAAAPPRSDKEMLVEILELGRAGANINALSVDVLKELSGALQALTSEVTAPRRAPFFSGLGVNVAPGVVSSFADPSLFAPRVASGGFSKLSDLAGAPRGDKAESVRAAEAAVTGLYRKEEEGEKKEGDEGQVPRRAPLPSRKGPQEK